MERGINFVHTFPWVIWLDNMVDIHSGEESYGTYAVSPPGKITRSRGEGVKNSGHV